MCPIGRNHSIRAAFRRKSGDFRYCGAGTDCRKGWSASEGAD
ncbi:MAG: hypothetical protein AB1696_19580 [Planctomycetota bacterium]